MPLDFDRTIIGEEFDRCETDPVTAEELIAFATALGETRPEYTHPGPDLVGHPTYCVKYKGTKFFPDNLPLQFRARMSFDAGKDLELGVPVRPGDRVTVTSTLHDVYEKTGRTGSMYFVVVRFALTNQRGELVANVDNRFMYKGLGG
jgi:N-terminal half of MaoC dehydratase